MFRGDFVLKNLLCIDVGPVPEAAVAAAMKKTENVDTSNMTTRQLFELHTTNTGCASCHRLIDPIGFGLENYDAIGRYRTTERNFPVDSQGELRGAGTVGLRTGRMINVNGQNTNNLLVSMAQLMGLKDVNRFGHNDFCTGPLVGLV